MVKIWKGKKRHRKNCSAWGIMDHLLLLLSSKPLTTSLTFQIIAELQHNNNHKNSAGHHPQHKKSKECKREAHSSVSISQRSSAQMQSHT